MGACLESSFSPSRGRLQQSVIESVSDGPLRPGGAPHRLLSADLTPGQELECATVANPLDALLGISLAPRMRRATQRTLDSPVATIAADGSWSAAVPNQSEDAQESHPSVVMPTGGRSAP